VEGVVNTDFWNGRRVFVTGHTGFKGGWLSLWLARMGAAIHGYSLNPPTTLNFFEQALLPTDFASDMRGDINDLASLNLAIAAAQPEIIFHLAAQPLVRAGYRDPLATLQTNVIGTANVLEVGRSLECLQATVVITTDKCYRNPETNIPFREDDPLGGHDPYSASKACAEIVTESYRSSYRRGAIASVRAGNVIGGGDWAEERLIPDCMRAFRQSEPVILRNPEATRPWQHVLEPLWGYLTVAQALAEEGGESLAQAYNFGPDSEGTATVGEIATQAAKSWGDAEVRIERDTNAPHEAKFLRLDSSLAKETFGWHPQWSLVETVEHTISWYRAHHDGGSMRDISLQQIADYEAATCR